MMILCLVVVLSSCNTAAFATNPYQDALKPYLGDELSAVHVAAVLGRQGIMVSLLAIGADVEAATKQALILQCAWSASLDWPCTTRVEQYEPLPPGAQRPALVSTAPAIVLLCVSISCGSAGALGLNQLGDCTDAALNAAAAERQRAAEKAAQEKAAVEQVCATRS